ncbi:hypothetical protein [Andreprevotia sp. IGB-42]|uniref:hypothetical protein n=1 Tax=Andreprevotia sp. IGB-42 TaxID=2497473 RepID=UPI0013584DDC|nr:hypothetical protein [Andreprevotia sp. IGB-42]
MQKSEAPSQHFACQCKYLCKSTPPPSPLGAVAAAAADQRGFCCTNSKQRVVLPMQMPLLHHHVEQLSVFEQFVVLIVQKSTLKRLFS